MEGERNFQELYVGSIVIGESPTSLEEAIKNGYAKLEEARRKPPFRVVEIFADGTNPFSGYRVVMRGDTPAEG